MGDWKFLRPDVVGVVLDVALSRVDALCQLIDADLFSTVGQVAVAPKRVDPVGAVGFDVFDETRVVGEPRVEFCDNLAGDIVPRVVILAVFVLFFLKAEGEWVGGFIIGVEA